MNLDFKLLNRALMNINVEPIGIEDREARTKVWETVKSFYLQTMLEALTEVEWTSAKRRRELAPMRMPCKKNPDFAHVYLLPVDCAKPIELDERVYYKVEGKLLFTDARHARLLYVSNGRKFYVPGGYLTGGHSKRKTSVNDVCTDYVTGGDSRRDIRFEWGDAFISGGDYERNSLFLPPPDWPEDADEDFPEYDILDFEPNFLLYWEYMLSSRYAARLTDQVQLADLWFAKAAMIGKRAQVVSLQQGAGKKTAPDTWQEALGIGIV